MNHLPALAATLLLLTALVALTCHDRGPDDGPKSLVINLRRNRERLRLFGRAYGASDFSGVPLERLEAVDGATVDHARVVHPTALPRLEAMKRSGVRLDHQDLTPGAVGCFLSHVAAWQAVARSAAPFGFVFEDDAHVTPGALAAFRKVSRAVGDWDVILLGWEGEGEPATAGARRMTRFLRLHAYAITREAARRLSASVLPVRVQVDWQLNELMRAGSLRVFGVDPAVVGVAYQGTDIQSPLAKK